MAAPQATAGDEDTRSDNIGIVVVGLGLDNIGYVLAARTCNLAPEGWARVAVTARMGR
jgi:phage terminase large subunit-like protein